VDASTQPLCWFWQHHVIFPNDHPAFQLERPASQSNGREVGGTPAATGGTAGCATAGRATAGAGAGTGTGLGYGTGIGFLIGGGGGSGGGGCVGGGGGGGGGCVGGGCVGGGGRALVVGAGEVNGSQPLCSCLQQ